MYALDVAHYDVNLADKLARIYSLQENTRLEMGFRRAYLDLLAALGNPHRKLPPVIHIAGTNGKGSTLAFTRAILNVAGYRCHAYTSPHLHIFNERVMLADRQISDSHLNALLDRVWAANNNNAVSFFEFTTALAFTAFAETPADFLLLETGLGGRLDCTNIIPHACVCGITSIGFDHTDILGETVREIAGEKAGIIKPDNAVVLGPQKEERAGDIRDVVGTAAADAGACLYSHGTDWHSQPAGTELRLRDRDGTIQLPQPALAGRHQYDNAATAAMICRRLAAQGRATISHQALCEGVASAKQDARLQKLDDVQAARLGAAKHNSIYVDSAHNGDAARALAGEIALWQARGESVALVIGMLAGKDATGTLAPLAATGVQATFVPIPGEAANMHNPADLAAIWSQHNGRGGDIVGDPCTAFQQACATAQTVVITGSGYLLRNFV